MKILAFLFGCLLSPGVAAQTKPIVIGAAIAQTGYLADLAAGTLKALQLWQEQLNAAGGLLGRPVELKLVDDASDALRSTELYEKLIREDRADVLIGSFGSAATSMAAAVAERNRRVMVNATGPSPEIHRKVFRYLFQVPPPADTTLSGVLPLAAKFGLKSVVVTASDAGTAAPLLEQLRRESAKRAVEVRAPMPYLIDPRQGLTPFAKQLAPTQPGVVLSPASAHDAASLLRGFKAIGYTPAVFIASGVVSPEYIRLVGQDAEYSVGYSGYETRAKTQGNAEFAKAYAAKYGLAPDFHAACGWAAGKVIEAAVARAGTLEQEKLRAAFAALETPTVLGAYKVAPDGSQLAATAFLVQILKGRREVIWPEAYRSAEPVLPMPEWSRRKPL
jgi:branched-chain amino acid transport system substrate-binding protein